MNIPRQKTKFELYSLVNLSYNDNDKKVLSDMTLHRIGVNSNNADVQKEKDSSIIVRYSIPSSSLINILKPLNQEINKRAFSNEISIEITINDNDILSILHSTEYSQNNEYMTSKVFFVLKRFDYRISYNSPKYGNIKNIDLLIFKMIDNELENLKLLHLVLKVTLKVTTLLEMMFNETYKSKFLLGNKMYNQNITITNDEVSLSDILISKYKEYDTDFIWILLCFVCHNMISYYELCSLLKEEYETINTMYKKNKEEMIGSMIKLIKVNPINQIKKKSELLTLIKENIKENNQVRFIKTISISPYNTKFEIRQLDKNEFNRKSLIQVKMINEDNNNKKYKGKYISFYFIFFLKKGIKLNSEYYYFYKFHRSISNEYTTWLKLIDTKESYQLDSLIDYLSFCHLPQVTHNIQTKTISKKDDYLTTSTPDKTPSILSKGCGAISSSIMKLIAKGLSLKYSLSYFIGKIDNIIGIWSNYDNTKKNIYYRPSMGVLDSSKEKEVKYYDYSKPSYQKGYLNQQLILYFQHFGVDGKYFISLLKKNINQMYKKPWKYFHCEIIKQVYELLQSHYSLSIAKDYYYQTITSCFNSMAYQYIQEEGKLRLSKSAILKGIVDEYNILKGSQVLVILSKLKDPKEPKNLHLKGNGVIVKLPCIFHHQIRKVKFQWYEKSTLNENNLSYYNKICNLTNVIVFPSRGKNSLLDELGSSSLRDDEFLVIWDEEITSKVNCTKIKEIEKEKEKEINTDILIENGVKIITEDIMTQFSNAQLSYMESGKDFLSNPGYIQTSESLYLCNHFTEYNTIIERSKAISKKSYRSSNKGNSESILGLIKDEANKLFDKRKITPRQNDNEKPLDYKNIGNALLQNEKMNDNLSLFYLYGIIVIIQLYTNFNSVLNRIMTKMKYKTYEDLLFLRKKHCVHLLKDLIIQISQEKERAFKVINILINERNTKSINMLYNDKQYILSCIAYNITFHLNFIESIINKNIETIKELLKGDESFKEKEQSTHYPQEEVKQYEEETFGINSCNYIHEDISNKESIQINVIKQTKDEDYILNLLNEIKNNVYGKNMSFCYILFTKYILNLKQVQNINK